MGGCSTCSLNSETKENGCSSGGCLSGGCNKLNVFDWLSDMDGPITERFDVVEVRFKNGRKSFYRNRASLDLHTGDSVVIDVPNGHHIGYVSLQGELVRLQMNKKKVSNDDSVRQIYRVASSNDLEKYEKVMNRENSTLYRSREIIQQMELKMKLTDVEFQADNSKATFYYSADERVDFRELIKVLAGEFKIRVEMKQISLRQEAGRMGGIGSCGRELCCSTWLTDFKSVTTGAARYQNLSLNPAKLSGQCGRLKCCLNYELDTYKTALEDIPKVEKSLLTEKGEAYLQKTDIFGKMMWFGYAGDSMWHPISAERVGEILELNAKGQKPESLQVDQDTERIQLVQEVTNDLDRLDRKYSPKNKRRKSKKKNRKRPNRNYGNRKKQE
jgi:cell fate regulator YaaT (PSP1 superfamily)